MLGGESSRYQHRRGGAAGRRASLQAGDRAAEMRRGQDLLQRQRVTKDRERIVGSMLARLDRDHRESLVAGTVELLILGTRTAEHLRRGRLGRIELAHLEKLGAGLRHRALAVVENRT